MYIYVNTKVLLLSFLKFFFFKFIITITCVNIFCVHTIFCFMIFMRFIFSSNMVFEKKKKLNVINFTRNSIYLCLKSVSSFEKLFANFRFIFFCFFLVLIRIITLADPM